MSRSRKQRERKLKAKLHEAQVKASNIKKQLAMQNDVMVNYVGGVAEFGHTVLELISRTNFIIMKNATEFGNDVLTTAKHMGFIERFVNGSGRFELTHMCKQLMGGSGAETKELSSTVLKEDTQ